MKRLVRCDQGAAALEFAILAPAFFAMLLMLIDLSIFFATRTIADDAVENGSRAVRLGILHADKDGAEFRKVLCGRILFLECENFSFSVASYDRLGGADIDVTPDLDEDGRILEPDYNVGGPEDIVVVTIVYVHKFIVPFIGAIFGDTNLSDPHQLPIVSYLVVKNEPFPDGGGS